MAERKILDGKVAIVTGAAQGIGLGVARAFAKEGAAVVINDLTIEKVASVADEIKAMGGRALAIGADVGKRSDVSDMVAAAVKEFGTVDILVNNAMAYNIKSIEETTDEDLDKVIKSALYGTFYCMQACFPYLKQHGGKIINFGSAAGTMGLQNHASYSAAKEGIIGLTRTASLEWAPHGIQTNAVAPVAATEAFETFAKNAAPEVIKNFMSQIPAGYVGDPERHIGRICVFLAGPDSDWITGRTIFADGGQGMIR